MKNYYKILGLNTTASQAEIKGKFRELALKHHPDVNKSPGAHDLFIDINEAYHYLSDSAKRNHYDLLNNSVKTHPADIKVYGPKMKNQKEWADFNRAKAETFARMPFDEYRQKLFVFLKEIHWSIAQLFGFMLGFGVFLNGLFFLLWPFLVLVLYFLDDVIIDINYLHIIWTLPMSLLCLLIGDGLFYKSFAKILGIKNRWAKIPFFKKLN